MAVFGGSLAAIGGFVKRKRSEIAAKRSVNSPLYKYNNFDI